ncbi:MAG: arginine repressor [Lachnospiraceae bacterium]|nr:arginine repressor [Lachnospiraceae bacterium]
MKNARHEKILELIENFQIETQEDLAEKLYEAGFQVTQATVSRDIRQLELHKVPYLNGRLRYAARHNGILYLGQKYRRILADSYVSADGAGNIVVIRTVSGMAMAAAAALDSLDWNELLGCIAGDDTIMACVRTKEDGDAFIEKLEMIARTKE